jgi:sugar/nucleoside kinase (ribokinase family)
MKEQKRPYDICCIGHTTLDRVITPAETVAMPGGTSIYFSNAMAALDVRYSLITSLAQSDQLVLASLREKGVAITVYSSAHTLFFENIYGHNPNDRTQRVLQEADPFTPQQVTGVDASIYHLGTLVAGDIPAAAIKALAAKGKLSLDVQGYLRKVRNQDVVPVDWEEKEELLPYVHFLKANEEEMAVLTGQTDAEVGAKQLLAWGAKEVIVTLGSEGSLIYTADDYYLIPAFVPTVLKDATGCGDTYMAGYLYKRCKGYPIEEAGKFAAAMATLKLQASGPFSGTEQEVEALLKRSKRHYAKL